MRLEVTPDELEGLAHGLSGLIGDLQHAGDIGSITSGAAENAELQAAIDGLVTRWTRDLQDVQTQLHQLATRLGAAGAAYDQAERGLTREIAVLPPAAEHVRQEIEA